MKQVKSNSKTLLLLPFLLCCLTGCEVSRKAGTSKLPENAYYLSSKVRLTIPFKGAVFAVNGTIKPMSGEWMQLSFLMLITRMEVAHMEATPEEVLPMDRTGKCYVWATHKELKDVLPKRTDFAHLERILLDAFKPEGRRELTGKELGIPSLGKGRVGLSGSSYDPFSLAPIELSSKYTEVELSEILEMLVGL